jgi:hypothetical protein
MIARIHGVTPEVVVAAMIDGEVSAETVEAGETVVARGRARDVVILEEETAVAAAAVRIDGVVVTAVAGGVMTFGVAIDASARRRTSRRPGLRLRSSRPILRSRESPGISGKPTGHFLWPISPR